MHVEDEEPGDVKQKRERHEIGVWRATLGPRSRRWEGLPRTEAPETSEYEDGRTVTI